MPYISDGLLRFLFSIPGVPAGIFHLALQLHEVCLQLLLGVDEASVLGGEAQVLLTRQSEAETPPPGLLVPHLGVQQLHSLIGVQQLLFGQLPSPLCLLQRCTQLLHLGLQQVGSALHNGQLLLQVLLAPESVIQV